MLSSMYAFEQGTARRIQPMHTPLAHMHDTAVTGYVMFSGRCGKGLQPSSPAQHVCHD